jgi:pimeloyl-ACP methyl ester carboxylesterase
MTRHFVFLHGSPGNARGWAPLTAVAPPGTTSHAFDLLDHGDGLDAPEATLDDIIADVVSRVSALGGAQVVLVGHSFGAWVAGHALPALEPRVARFVSIAGLASLPPDITARSMAFADALEAGQLSLSAAVGAACDIWLPAEGRDPEHAERVRALIEGDTPARLARVQRRHAGVAAADRIVPRSTTPALMIHASEDRGVPIAFGRGLLSRFERGIFVELEGDSHFPQWTHTARVAELVYGDLDSDVR